MSHSLPDSDINKEDDKLPELSAAAGPSQLMTIKEKLSSTNGRVNPVPGYPDSENMWRKLVNLEKDPISTVSRHPNNKSVFTIQVHDKVFKLKKNPAYTGPLNLPELQPDPAEALASEE